MGCGASAQPKTQQNPVVSAPPATSQPAAHAQPQQIVGKFQIKLSGQWKDYEALEDNVLKRAYSVGYPNASFQLRGQGYEYDFVQMKQKNKSSNKERDIRPPMGMKPPASPLIPKGPMLVYTVKPSDVGKQTIQINDPNNKGSTIHVNIPAGAKPGQKIAIPVPGPNETVQQVVDKQKKHGVADRVAMGVAGAGALGVVAVGGVLLSDHLMGGSLATDAVDGIAGHVGGAVADIDISGATDAVAGAAGDVGDAVAGSGAIDAIGGAAEEAGGFLEGIGEDAGDFIMNLF